jgi:hypothetical protein
VHDRPGGADNSTEDNPVGRLVTDPQSDLRLAAGLVRLGSVANYYFQPKAGAPTPTTFFDNAARPENRCGGRAPNSRSPM